MSLQEYPFPVTISLALVAFFLLSGCSDLASTDTPQRTGAPFPMQPPAPPVPESVTLSVPPSHPVLGGPMIPGRGVPSNSLK